MAFCVCFKLTLLGVCWACLSKLSILHQNGGICPSSLFPSSPSFFLLPSIFPIYLSCNWIFCVLLFYCVELVFFPWWLRLASPPLLHDAPASVFMGSQDCAEIEHLVFFSPLNLVSCIPQILPFLLLSSYLLILPCAVLSQLLSPIQ